MIRYHTDTIETTSDDSDVEVYDKESENPENPKSILEDP